MFPRARIGSTTSAVNQKFADALLEEIDGDRRARRAGAGLPFRAAAAHDQGARPGRARGHLLAHSVAQSGGVRHLPVAARTAGRHAGRGPDRLPHPGALQQFSGNRGPRAGIAHRLGALRGERARPVHHGAAVPHQRAPSHGVSSAARRRSRVYAGARGALARTGRGGTHHGRGRGPRGLHQGHSGAVSRHRAVLREVSGLSRASSRLCRSARPAARTSSAITI